MTVKQYGKNFSGKVTIQRTSERELDLAIAELEKRGYAFDRRGVDVSEQKQFSYRENKGPKMKFSGSETRRKCWAIMRKVMAQ